MNVPLPDEIRLIYDEYLAQTRRLEIERRPTDGLLGFGKSPGSDACHDRFAERLEKALNDLADSAPSSGDVRATLQLIYNAPPAHKNNRLAYWMLLAVHALTEPLISLLSPEDAAILSTLYTEIYPKSVRLPAQKKTVLLLQQQAGEQLGRAGRASGNGRTVTKPRLK